MDEKIAKKVEPGASPPRARFRALGVIGKTKAYTGFHLMPILPFLADGETTIKITKVKFMITWQK